MKSRFREIEAKLGVYVGDAIKDGAERIADRAKATAPVETPPHGPPMELKKSIDTRPGPSESFRGGAGVRWDVVAVWYWFLVEFGHEGPHPAPPHPFMIPVVEAERASIVADVERRLRNL